MVKVPATTFPALLEQRLRREPGSPLVTYYDDETGERTELSATSLANWVAKHANLFRDELDLDDDATILLDLPPHWLVPVVLGGAWTAGLAVTTDTAAPHDVVVTGADDLESHLDSGALVLACSLHPFALPVAGTLPPGVLDLGHLWPGQSDVFVPPVPVLPTTPAWRSPDLDQRGLLAAAGEAAYAVESGTRLLTDAHPASGQGVPALLAPLLAGGSVVYVRHGDPDGWAHRAEQERATLVRRG